MLKTTCRRPFFISKVQLFSEDIYTFLSDMLCEGFLVYTQSCDIWYLNLSDGFLHDFSLRQTEREIQKNRENATEILLHRRNIARVYA